MHADIHRRERQTNGRGRGCDDGTREDGQLQLDLRKGHGSPLNADRVLTRVARFDHVPVCSSRAAVVVIAVLILNGNGLRAAVMAMTMQRRAVLMVGMIMTAIRMHMHRRHRSRKTGHGQREHERKEATHGDESTTIARMPVKSPCGSAHPARCPDMLLACPKPASPSDVGRPDVPGIRHC